MSLFNRHIPTHRSNLRQEPVILTNAEGDTANTDDNRQPPLLKPDPILNLKPPLLVPDSPLTAWLRACSPNQRRSLKHITLTSELGYQCRFKFDDAEQLYRWLTPHLKGQTRVFMGTIWRSELYRIKDFDKEITFRLVMAHCKKMDRKTLKKRA